MRCMDLGSCRGCSGQAGALGGQGFVSATHTVGEYVNPRVKITWSNPTANIAGLMRYNVWEPRARGFATTLGQRVMIIDGLVSSKSKLFICAPNARRRNSLLLFISRTSDPLLIKSTVSRDRSRWLLADDPCHTLLFELQKKKASEWFHEMFNP